MEELFEVIKFLKSIRTKSSEIMPEFEEFIDKMPPRKFKDVPKEIFDVVQRYDFHFDFFVENPEECLQDEDYYGKEKLYEHIDNFFSELKALGVDVDSIESES